MEKLFTSNCLRKTSEKKNNQKSYCKKKVGSIKLLCRYHESTSSCKEKWKHSFGTQRRSLNHVEHLRRSFFAKIVNSLKPLTIFPKKLHRTCSTGFQVRPLVSVSAIPSCQSTALSGLLQSLLALWRANVAKISLVATGDSNKKIVW